MTDYKISRHPYRADMKHLKNWSLLPFIYVRGKLFYKRSVVDRLIGVKQVFMVKNRRHGY